MAAVNVVWLPQGETPGSHFFVQYRLNGATMFESTPPEYYEDYIVVSGLEVGTLYEFRIVAVDGNFDSVSPIEEVETWHPGGGKEA